MSNPAVYLLAEIKIRDKIIRIEDNLGESIHIHIGDFRFSISVMEFNKIVDSVLEAANQLLELKGLSMKDLDEDSMDWDWLSKYDKIKRIEKKNICLKNLHTVGYKRNSKFVQIVPVSESRFVKALNGDDRELWQWNETNMYGKDNGSRLEDVLNLVKTQGYPFENKLIMTNQYGQIYDGDHRAACLYYLKGGEFTIPVLELEFEDQLTVEEQKRNEKKKYFIYRKNAVKNYIKNLFKTKAKKMWSEELNVLEITLKEFLRKLEELQIEYFIFANSLESLHWGGGRLVVEQGKMIELCKATGLSYYGKSIYRHYKFLYSMQRAVYVELKDISMQILDRMCCKSKFENSLLPLDKEIIDFSWEERKLDSDKGFYVAGEITELLFVIVNCILNKNAFEESDKLYLQKRKELLFSKKLSNLLEKEFFGFTEKLLESLQKEEYSKIIDGYVRNTDY